MSAELKPLDIEKERAEFEAVGTKIYLWSEREYEKNRNGDYTWLDIRRAFGIWLAAKRSTTPAVTGQAAKQVPDCTHPYRNSTYEDLVRGYWECATCGYVSLADDVAARRTQPAVTAEAVGDGAPDTSQEWAKLDGVTAFHLIERHADDWAETGRMMESWRIARTAAVKAAGQGGEDAREWVVLGGRRLGKTFLAELERDAARYRFRKQFLASGGTVHFGSFGCQYRRPGELVSQGATEEEAIDAARAALTNKADGGGA